MQQREHPSLSCRVACSSLVQAEKLAYADSSLGWRFETLIEALLLVPDWVGCCRGTHPSPVKFGKASIVLVSSLSSHHCLFFRKAFTGTDSTGAAWTA